MRLPLLTHCASAPASRALFSTRSRTSATGLVLFGALAVLSLTARAQEPPAEPAPETAAAPAPAAPNPASVLSPEDRQKFLERLEELAVQRESMRSEGFRTVIQQLGSLLNSPTDAAKFYEDSVRDLDFTGQDESMSSEFRDWKDRQRDRLRDGDFRAALLFHLRYLMLTMQYLGTPEEERARMVDPIVSYVKDLGAAPDSMKSGRDAREFLFQPLGRSVFVRKLQLQDELGRLGEWEQEPGNLSGIEEVTLLPLLRRYAPERVMPFWEFKIGREMEEARNARLMVTAANFQDLELPRLQWARAQDMLRFGNPREAFLEMARIVEANPAHPDFPNWLQTIRGYLEPAPTAAAPAAE